MTRGTLVTRSMANTTGMSQSAVSRIWRAFGLKPHLVDSVKLSPDPLFIETVRDVVGRARSTAPGVLGYRGQANSTLQHPPAMAF
jgi:hypothetical protein